MFDEKNKCNILKDTIYVSSCMMLLLFIVFSASDVGSRNNNYNWIDSFFYLINYYIKDWHHVAEFCWLMIIVITLALGIVHAIYTRRLNSGLSPMLNHTFGCLMVTMWMSGTCVYNPKTPLNWIFIGFISCLLLSVFISWFLLSLYRLFNKNRS